jgi:hypothetical protein
VPRQPIPGNRAEQCLVSRSWLYYAGKIRKHTRTRLLIIITIRVNLCTSRKAE